jgi:subtilase family serine protease
MRSIPPGAKAHLARMKAPLAITKALVALALLLPALAGSSASAANRTLAGHVPQAVAQLNLASVGRPPAESRLRLAIGLPLHNQEDLTHLLDQIYDPRSSSYHQFLTPEEFTQRFGPTEAEYEQVIRFAEGAGMRVLDRYDNRVLLDVSGTVAEIESAFHITLHTYEHPKEARQFYAPDVEPAVDASLPILDISGLDNFVLPHPMLHRLPDSDALDAHGAAGSGPSGTYMGLDFRNAYASGVTLTGTGQVLGLVEGDSYYAADITNYENQAGLRHVPLQSVLLDSLTTTPSGDTLSVAEVSLDIEVAVAMAPGLTKIVLFEGNVWNDILNTMAGNSGFKQLSSSWSFGGPTSTSDQILQQMAVQGQSFLQASGDGDAWVGNVWWPGDDLYVTSVGGTTLTMNGSGASYSSETVWNSGSEGTGKGWCCNPDPNTNTYWGSGGGVSTSYSIPSWQSGVSMATNGGSTTRRNVPDVAMVGNQVWVIYMNGLSGSFEGTSIAAPLWASFIALANQQAASSGQAALGFLNPALYSIGSGSAYNSCFNDITTGNNTSTLSPSNYYAVTGYDLCSGWGTPNGASMINALMPFSGAVWVDFNYSGTQNGTYTFPYSTLAQGVSAVSASGNLWVRSAGTSHETPTLTKPMTIAAFRGLVTIGH